MRPRHPQPDGNQSQIVGQLRDLGYVVHDVSALGGDALDLFVMGLNVPYDRFDWLQVEVKTEQGVLTPDEAAYIQGLEMDAGCAVPVIVARSLDDVLRWFGQEV